MSSYTQSIQNLMNELASLPGVGTRSAERIAFHLLKQRPEDAMRLSDAIRDVKTRIKHCTICFNLTEQDPCNICQNPARDHTVVCVVEQPKDLLALESTGLFRGVYHVLLGRIAPLEGVDPEDVTAEALVNRLADGTIKEVIMGTNPNIEGDGTALHIQQQIVERFPDLLSDAINGRQKM
jgi:recombination protein RecR